MFDRIAPRYDLLNHLLSFNRDKAWRRKMTLLLPTRPKLTLLDLATGTGDQLLSLYDSGKIASGVGIDPAEGMLAIGREKIARRRLSATLSLILGSAEQIPFGDRSFDIVTISFGIRNVTDVPLALKEMHRVLKPGGRALILEFSLPKNAVIRGGYLVYFRYILPFLGGIISGDREAYRYLNQTVESFPYGDQFTALMCKAGFGNVKHTPLTFGVATIYQGDKQ
jgi:demethylmenaquinone methyltransferase/2-methoxy-6-polyprenyl-1,4-benzoquinol methylase